MAPNTGRDDLNAAFAKISLAFLKKAGAAIPQYLSDDEHVIAVLPGDGLLADGSNPGFGLWALTDQRLLFVERKARTAHNFPLSKVDNVRVQGRSVLFEYDGGHCGLDTSDRDAVLADFQKDMVYHARMAQSGNEPSPAAAEKQHSPRTGSVSGVTKWDYRHLVVNQGGLGGKTPADLGEQLSRLGEQGWELVSAFPLTTGTGVSVSAVYLFKRPYE